MAAAHDRSVGDLALAWLAAQPAVGSVIAGATRVEQVQANVAALEWRLDDETLAAVETALAPPAYRPAVRRSGGQAVRRGGWPRWPR